MAVTLDATGLNSRYNSRRASFDSKSLPLTHTTQDNTCPVSQRLASGLTWEELRQCNSGAQVHGRAVAGAARGGRPGGGLSLKAAQAQLVCRCLLFIYMPPVGFPEHPRELTHSDGASWVRKAA